MRKAMNQSRELHLHRPSFSSCDLHPWENFNGFCPSCLYDRLTTLHPTTATATSSSLFRRTKSFSASFVPHRLSCDVRVPTHPSRNAPDFSRVRVPIESPLETGGPQPLNHNAGGEIGGKFRGRVPIEVGGPLTLANSVGDDFGGKFGVRVPIEVRGAPTLNHNVGDEIRDFGKKIRVPNDGPIRLIEEKPRGRVPVGASIAPQARVRVPIEAGRGRALGCNVGDKIKVFEEQSVPIIAKRAQTLAQNVGGEIRHFEEKIRVRVPIEPMRAQAINHDVGDEIMVLEEQNARIEEQSRVRVPIEAGRAHDEIRVFEEEETKRMRDYIDLDFQSKKKKPSVGFWSAASVFSKKWSKWMKKQKAKKQGSDVEKTGLPLSRHLETQSEVADYGLGRRSCDTDPRFSIDIGRFSMDGPRPSFVSPRASWDGHMARRSNFSDHRFSTIETIPGDTLQTHQYYLDTSSRRRRSFDRSGLKNSSSLVIGAEVDEMKLGSNAKVTPETFDFHKRKSNSNSLRDECSEIFELGIRDDGSIIGNVKEKGSERSGRWGKKWSFWGLIYKRNKYNEDDRSSSVKGNIRGGTSGDMYRRSSSVGVTNSYNVSGLSGGVRNKGVGENGRKKSDEVLDRNGSVDNGLLRFYLTPPRSKSPVFGSRKSSGTDNSRTIPKGVYRY